MRSRLPIFLCVLSLVAPISVRAQWVYNGTMITAVDNSAQFAVSDGAGGMIITWQDQRIAGTFHVYAQRIDVSGVPKWSSDGVAICTATGNQFVTGIVSDGAGGAIIAWYDWRSGFASDIYVQRVNASGTPQWAPNGVLLCGAPYNQFSPVLVSDGAAGAIVAWTDIRNGTLDVYARRVNSAGVPQWTADGVALCTAGNDQLNIAIASDGSGGAIVSWEDSRGGIYADIYAQRINGSGAVQWAANGAPVCLAGFNQSLPFIVSDGSAGVVIAWSDFRNFADTNIWAQRVGSTGAGLWTLNGVPVCSSPGAQYNPVVTWDNTTGAIVAWHDDRSGQSDVYASRITPNGSVVWTADGLAVCTAVNNQTLPRIVSDGSGGAVIAWNDGRGGDVGIYSQRVDATGLAIWANDGVPVCTAPNGQGTVSLVADGNGGVNVLWPDQRSGASDIYAQHVEGRYGYWGKPEPMLFAAKDVPADQGGKVRLEWYASGRDKLNQQTITHYTIWRAIDQAAFASASSADVPTVNLSDVGAKFSGKAIRHEKAQAVDYFWELIGEQDATYRYAYAFTASTSFDSTTANAATHRFQIVSHATSPRINWPSNVISGRSVDNLAPPPPLALTAQRVGNYVYLKWNGVHIPDFNKYTVYRATSSGVTPILPNFLADDTDTLLTDTSAPATSLYYIVTATDVHQNQSLKSNESNVSSATSAGNLPPVTALTVRQNHPNPFTGETTLEVGLPSAADVSVEVYDVAGRRVHAHAFARQTKGWSTLRLDSRDRNGALLPSGVYFYRVRAGSEIVTNKMVIAR